MAEENKTETTHVPDGIYYGKAIEGSEQWGKSKNGNSQLGIMCTLEGEAWAGVTLPWYPAITGNTIDRIVEALHAMGWKGQEFTRALPGIGEKRVQLVVKTSEYEGKKSTRIEFVNDPARAVGFKEPLSDAEFAAFALNTRARIATALAKIGSPKQSGPATTAPAPAREPGSDDAVPF